MGDPFFDKFIADLVKGAAASEGFVRGSRVQVVVGPEKAGREEKLASHAGLGALENRYAQGAIAAAATFGLKEAFLGAALPMLGSMFGGTAARAIGGKVAPKMMAGLGSGLKSHAFDAAGSALGGMAGQHLAPQQPQGM